MDNTCSNEAAPTPNDAATCPKKIPHSKPVLFASILSSEKVHKKVNFRSFVNEERVENSYTVLLKAAMESVKNRYVNSLVGYFIGKSLAFPVVQNYVNNTWEEFGLQKVMRNDDGVFMLKFASEEGLEQVLQRGPWMIRKSPIILTKWSSSLSLKKGEVTSVSVWVKLHGVPILVYSEDGLSLIATQIGKPLLLDASTSSMCVES
ncbi:nucleotide-binding alpha-beta plait domain-containing protein [Tanacetum coccineum]